MTLLIVMPVLTDDFKTELRGWYVYTNMQRCNARIEML
jgi:hypothetical protein